MDQEWCPLGYQTNLEPNTTLLYEALEIVVKRHSHIPMILQVSKARLAESMREGMSLHYLVYI